MKLVWVMMFMLMMLVFIGFSRYFAPLDVFMWLTCLSFLVRRTFSA